MAQEVLDFVGFLAAKSQQGAIKDLMLAQEKSLGAIWGNAEDEVWNDV